MPHISFSSPFRSQLMFSPCIGLPWPPIIEETPLYNSLSQLLVCLTFIVVYLHSILYNLWLFHSFVNLLHFFLSLHVAYKLHGLIWSLHISSRTRSACLQSVQFSRSVVSDSLRPHESQHARPPCPSPTPRVHSNSRPSNRWCHPAISSSVVPFSSCPQSLPASGSFPMSQLFTSGGQSIGVSASASVLPKNTQDWSPLGWTGWIFLLER